MFGTIAGVSEHKNSKASSRRIGTAIHGNQELQVLPGSYDFIN
jgi:hypothetical protein